jgi:hypothetical protein
MSIRTVAAVTVFLALVLAACASPPESVGSLAPVPAESSADCAQQVTAFAAQSALVTVKCAGEQLLIHSPTGLADPDPSKQSFRMMVGITAWILRVPVPFEYNWRLPLAPTWMDTAQAASPKGPIGVAVNGVPIFHYEARPDAPTEISAYDPGSDTVVKGELDHCGGHSGQGEDYHYHYAPVCLLVDHDVQQPIGFGLDGAPIFFGTGGTDYYGSGQFNSVDNLPKDGKLDDCNAIAEQDGWVHYTTVTPPYLVGCHHGQIEPNAQIEPRPMRAQGTTASRGGQVGEAANTLVTDWFIDDQDKYHLEYDSLTGGGTSAIVYYPSTEGGDCWVFDYRADSQKSGETETACRPAER